MHPQLTLSVGLATPQALGVELKRCSLIRPLPSHAARPSPSPLPACGAREPSKPLTHTITERLKTVVPLTYRVESSLDLPLQPPDPACVSELSLMTICLTRPRPLK